MPVRIQRKRIKGWKMPPNTVYVGRPTVYGNPFRVGDFVSVSTNDQFAIEYRWQAKSLFDMWLFASDQDDLRRRIEQELRGKNLACWCGTGAYRCCHADTLLQLANQPAG